MRARLADETVAALANLPTGWRSNKNAGTALGISERSVTTARRIRKEALPAIVAKVESGKMSLNEAAQTLTQPELEHDEATDFVPAPGVMEKIAELRREWSGIVAGVESLAEKMVSFRRDIDAAGADLPLPDREVIGLLQKVRDCVILESMPPCAVPMPPGRCGVQDVRRMQDAAEEALRQAAARATQTSAEEATADQMGVRMRKRLKTNNFMPHEFPGTLFPTTILRIPPIDPPPENLSTIQTPPSGATA